VRNASLAVTSGVGTTESKLIIALKRQLVQAKEIIERDHLAKLKLVQMARGLRSQLLKAG